MNRDRPPMFRQQQQQQQPNRYRPPARPNNRPGQPLNPGERILVARREAADPNQSLIG